MADLLTTAIADHQAGRLAEAERRYRQILASDPNNAVALCNLGLIFEAGKMPNEAVACFRRAIELKPDYVDAHYNLGTVLQGNGRFDEAAEQLRRVIELNPGHALAHNNLGSIFQAEGKVREALACFDRAIELNPNYADAHTNRSLLKLLQGDLTGGWREYQWRWKTGRIIERTFSQPKWNGKLLGQRTILLLAEQGFGDEIQFIRYAGLVKERNPTAKVIVECRRSLIKLLSTCPGVDEFVACGDPLPYFDVHCLLLDLLGVLKTTVETIPANVPYLFADSSLVTDWQNRLSTIGGSHVGISWQGSINPIEFPKRDIPLEQFTTLADIAGVSLISLQKGSRPPPPIIDLGDIDATNAFTDSAAIMANLDLVITCDTSIAHLAGALGAPVWVALPLAADWRWLLDRSDSPWYPTMKLFRQKKAGDWAGVFEEIRAELHKGNNGRSS